MSTFPITCIGYCRNCSHDIYWHDPSDCCQHRVLRQTKQQRNAERTLDKLYRAQRELAELDVDDLALRTSRRGVPHLVGTHKGHRFSVAWFHRQNTFKAFYPYPSSYQGRATQTTALGYRLLDTIERARCRYLVNRELGARR